MVAKDDILRETHDILAANIGNYGAELYQDYYQDKSVKDILASLEALLSELVGPKNTAKQLSHLRKKLER